MMLVKLEMVGLLHVTPFHKQVGREGFQLEIKVDCLEMEDLKDKRRWVSWRSSCCRCCREDDECWINRKR